MAAATQSEDHGPAPLARQPSPRPFAPALLTLLATLACDAQAPSIALSPTAVELPGRGDTVWLTAVVHDGSGRWIPRYGVVWSTSDASVATVRAGLVRARGAGVATITAAAGSASATATIAVTPDWLPLLGLYNATRGPGWRNRSGWFRHENISEWFGVVTSAQGRVVELGLNSNDLRNSLPGEIEGLTRLRRLYLPVNTLSGSLPPEIGNLKQLRELYLHNNDLSGSIPPEIGSLTELRELGLRKNAFSGPIPPELGNLRNLSRLELSDNAFTGPIPPELGNLRGLSGLELSDNALTGSIPAELGNLANVTHLYAQDNALSGEIPGELGDLSQLIDLWLGGNELTGPFPVGLTRLSSLFRLVLVDNPLTGTLPDEIGDMASLGQLLLTNSGLSGLLPVGMTRLQRLEELMLGGTGLCAPDDDDFRAWLDGVTRRRVPTCREPGDRSAAYLTQAVQSRAYPVSLVAGEDALLRVFAVAPAAAGETIPLVRATFYLDGEVEEVVEIEPGSSAIGEEVNEGLLTASANALVPASVIQPGLEMVVEIDPDGTMDPELGVMQRIPETGRAAVEVSAMPALELTLIPFLWSVYPDSTILDLTNGLHARHPLMWQVSALLPVGGIDLRIHAPVVTDSNNGFALLRHTRAIYSSEGGSGYYMGMMSGRITGPAGVAEFPGWASFSIPDSTTMSHELGHNMYVYHAPCGGAGSLDPSFPEPDGTIGAWGYSFVSRKLVDPGTFDLMSYCEPEWISDFHFSNALRYRLSVEGAAKKAGRAAPARSLLIAGGIDRNGIPHLEPVFVIDAPPSLPPAGGAHGLTGRAANGAELFALNFAMPEIADGDGSSSFAFVVPAQSGWETDLARITLSGPKGSVTLDTDSARPAVIMRDPGTGQIRAILSDLPPDVRTAADAARLAPEPGLEILFSRGIPGAATWRR